MQLEIFHHIVEHIWSSEFRMLIRYICLSYPCKGWRWILVCDHMLPRCQKYQACQLLWMLLEVWLELSHKICHFLKAVSKKPRVLLSCFVLQNVSCMLKIKTRSMQRCKQICHILSLISQQKSINLWFFATKHMFYNSREN